MKKREISLQVIHTLGGVSYRSSSTFVVVCLSDCSRYICGVEGHITGPLSKSSIIIHGFHPILQETTFDPGLLGILAFDLQHQMDTICQQDDEIRPIPMVLALEDVVYSKA